MKRASDKDLLPEKVKRVKRKSVLSDIDKQITDDLYIEITTNASEVILPTNIKKYYGSICAPCGLNKKWISRFRGNYNYKTASHFSEQEAIDYVKEVNIKNGWPIRNIIYKYGNEYYCHLTKNQMTLFSPEHLDIVQNYTWCAFRNEKRFCAVTWDVVKKKFMYYHQMIFPNLKKGETVDHINRISLDNRTENMRIASMRTQSLNKDIRINNTSGIIGVRMHEKRYYATQWRDENYVTQYKFFSIKIHGPEKAFEMAVDYRKYIERTLPHYVYALKRTK